LLETTRRREPLEEGREEKDRQDKGEQEGETESLRGEEEGRKIPQSAISSLSFFLI